MSQDPETKQRQENSMLELRLDGLCCVCMHAQNRECQWKNILEDKHLDADYSNKNENMENKQNL